MTHADELDAMQLGPDPDKLLVYHRRQLSAMLDGELSPDEAKFMLRRLQHDGDLAACWERWQVCGDMLRGTHHALLPSDFADRVARGLQADAAVAVAPPQTVKPPRLLRWGGGAALAASVALVAVFATRQLPEPAQPADAAVGQPLVASSATTAPAPADARDQAQPAPAPADAVAPMVLATAVAATELPRRNARRRNPDARSTPAAADATAQDAVAQQNSAVPPQLSVADATPTPVDGVAELVFPAPQVLQARPWPRARLPGAGGGAFNAGYGRLPSFAPSDAEDDPFQPRSASPLAAGPATESGAEASPAASGPPRGDVPH